MVIEKERNRSSQTVPIFAPVCVSSQGTASTRRVSRPGEAPSTTTPPNSSLRSTNLAHLFWYTDALNKNITGGVVRQSAGMGGVRQE